MRLSTILSKQEIIEARQRGIDKYLSSNGRLSSEKNCIIGEIGMYGVNNIIVESLKNFKLKEFLCVIDKWKDNKDSDSGLVEMKTTTTAHDRFFLSGKQSQNGTHKTILFSRIRAEITGETWEKFIEYPAAREVELSGYLNREQYDKRKRKYKDGYLVQLNDLCKKFDATFWKFVSEQLVDYGTIYLDDKISQKKQMYVDKPDHFDLIEEIDLIDAKNTINQTQTQKLFSEAYLMEVILNQMKTVLA